MPLAKSAKIGIPANATHGVQSDVASAGLFEKAANLSVVLRRHNVKIGKIVAEIFWGVQRTNKVQVMSQSPQAIWQTSKMTKLC